MNKERNYNRRYPNEYNIFRTMFYMAFLYFVVIPFMKIFYDCKISGRENLPTKAKSGKFIYTANHVSHFDPPMVTMACGRPIAYMAKKELFQKGDKFEWLVKRLGAFAVDRTKPEIATFKTVKDKADSFQVVKNATEKLKEKNINKDTALGAGVAIVAVVLAAKCLKGIIGKIAEIGKK